MLFDNFTDKSAGKTSGKAEGKSSNNLSGLFIPKVFKVSDNNSDTVPDKFSGNTVVDKISDKSSDKRPDNFFCKVTGNTDKNLETKGAAILY